MNRLIERLNYNKDESSKKMVENIMDQKFLALASALLHDLGHGPFSHALEGVTKIKHEVWTREIVKGDTEINRVLEEHKKGFSNEVAEVINRTHNNKAVVKLLSSQLDADRVDWIRDSLMTGAGYGSFDLEWLIHCVRLGEVNGFIEVGLDLEKGLSIAEDFVMARYYMYRNVYFHKTTRCAEMIIDRIFTRVLELKKEGSSIDLPEELVKVINVKKITQKELNCFLRLTDYKIWYYIERWSYCDDQILSEFCKRLLYRDFYKSVKIPEGDLLDLMEKLFEIASKQKVSHKYLFLQDNPKTSSYKDSYITSKPEEEKEKEKHGEKEASEQIFLFDKKGDAKELSQESRIINTIRNNPISIPLFFVREDLKESFV